MTLSIKKFFKRGGKIKRTHPTPRRNFSYLPVVMERYAPGITSTAEIQYGDKFVINFDADKANDKLLKELGRLRVDLPFDFYIADDKPSRFDKEAIPTTDRYKYKKRLFIEFRPRNDVEWALIKDMFGFKSTVGDDVSSLEEILTVGDR